MRNKGASWPLHLSVLPLWPDSEAVGSKECLGLGTRRRGHSFPGVLMGKLAPFSLVNNCFLCLAVCMETLISSSGHDTFFFP